MTRLVPESTLFHFALPQREYSAVLAAVQYFATKLQNPRERELATSALQWLQNITGMSLPSEAGASGTGELEKMEVSNPPTQDPTPSPAKGLASLKGTSK